MRLYTGGGMPCELGDEIGMGREGAVHAIVGHRALAKIYHEPSPELAKKIETMAGACPKLLRLKSPLLKHMAWPARALYRFPKRRGFVGFMMPRAPDGAVSLGVASQYPTPADARKVSAVDRIRAAIGLCDAMSELHAMGIVIGDLNPSNILVGENGVYLIDIDSYGFELGGHRFDPACAAEGFVAPEVLQELSASDAGDFGELARAKDAPVFTPQSDAFGLAVHVFMLLNQGWHPFNGLIDLDTLGPDEVPSPLSPNANVQDGKSPFAETLKGYLVPDWVLSLNDFPLYLSQAFSRSLFGAPGERLTAEQWTVLLSAYLAETVECPHGHRYHVLVPGCPYCRCDQAALNFLEQ